MWTKPRVISKSLAQIVLCAWLMASSFSNCWVIIFNCCRRKIKCIPHVPYLNIKTRLVHNKFQQVCLTVQAEVFRPLFSHLCCCLLVKPKWFNYYSFNNLPWELRMFLAVWEHLRCLFLRWTLIIGLRLVALQSWSTFGNVSPSAHIWSPERSQKDASLFWLVREQLWGESWMFQSSLWALEPVLTSSFGKETPVWAIERTRSGLQTILKERIFVFNTILSSLSKSEAFLTALQPRVWLQIVSFGNLQGQNAFFGV